MKRCEIFSGSRISNVVEPHRSVVHQCDYWGGHVENDEWIEEENANEYDVRCLLLQSARRHRRRGVSLFQTRYSLIHTPFCSSLFFLEKKRPTAGSDVDAIRIKTRTCKKSSTKWGGFPGEYGKAKETAGSTTIKMGELRHIARDQGCPKAEIDVLDRWSLVRYI